LPGFFFLLVYKPVFLWLSIFVAPSIGIDARSPNSFS